MILAWIVITIMFALVAGFIVGAMNDGVEGAVAAFFVVQLSFLCAFVYVAAHFISKFW